MRPATRAGYFLQAAAAFVAVCLSSTFTAVARFSRQSQPIVSGSRAGFADYPVLFSGRLMADERPAKANASYPVSHSFLSAASDGPTEEEEQSEDQDNRLTDAEYSAEKRWGKGLQVPAVKYKPSVWAGLEVEKERGNHFQPLVEETLDSWTRALEVNEAAVEEIQNTLLGAADLMLAATGASVAQIADAVPETMMEVSSELQNQIKGAALLATESLSDVVESLTMGIRQGTNTILQIATNKHPKYKPFQGMKTRMQRWRGKGSGFASRSLERMKGWGRRFREKARRFFRRKKPEGETLEPEIARQQLALAG